MKDSSFTLDQVTDLRAIEKIRIKAGQSGFRGELQSLINRLKSGGVGIKTDDPREAQAKTLWDKGWGRELKMNSFDEYLVTIPVIDEKLLDADERFPLLVLVDTRISIVKTCELLLNCTGSYKRQGIGDFDPAKARTEKVYWIRVQDGKKNRGKSVHTCREEFAKDEFGLTAHEGLAIFAQNPEVLHQGGLDLTGSVDENVPGYTVALGWYDGHRALFYHTVAEGHPEYGSGSRRE